ncbi:MAG: phosphoribosylglycinamide synthetase C domain-containing protein [Candidatus Diapherotrites archaeon]
METNHEPKPEKKKFLFVSIDALIDDIAWQVIKEGHEAKFFIQDPEEKEVGDGFVQKVDDWEKEVSWADVIVFDDVLGQGTKAKKLRDGGKLVIGGTPYTDKLEDDRAFGQEEMKKAGIPILPYRDFTSFDEAIEFVKQNPGKYVIKPSGEAQNIKGLLFIGEEDDGRDVIQVLTDYKNAWSKKIPLLQLQKRVEGVEVAVGAFFNGKEFTYPINVNFEHKKLFPGDLGPSTGEMGCYDDKTEVLTKSGWKVFRNATKEDEFITLNKKGIIEYQKPSELVCLGTHKKLLLIKNQTIDLAVTLDHNMYGIEANKYRQGKRNFGFIKARNLPSQFVVPRTGKWIGKKQKEFILPSVKKYHREGKGIKEKTGKETRINMNDWLKFLGFYIAEGSCSKGFKVSLACVKNRKEAKKMLSMLPFKLKEGKTEFYFYDKQLWNYLKLFGKADKKFAPSFVKELCKKQIEMFLEWYGKGDGNENNGFRIFYTSSRKLADDVQELLLKIGRTGIIKKREKKGKIWIKDHWAKINHPQYEILERIKKSNSWIDKRDMEITAYNGKVYCATVPNHVLFVRKNGKPLFCGNTAMFWSGPNRLFNQTLKKMEPKLAEEGFVGYIDINTIVNGYGIYPLEFTSRFGYPTISIQQEGMITPIGEFFYDLAAGNKPKLRVKSGFQIGVRIVVPPFPFFDQETFDVKSKDSVIFFKKPTEGVHIEDVKKVNDEWLVTGTTGVVLIVCGTGQTMKQAQHQVYGRIKNIRIPHMYYRKDIGDRWFNDSDRLHNWGYLRET